MNRWESGLVRNWFMFSLTVDFKCHSAEKQTIQQARLLQQQDDEHEADGEEDDEEEEEEEEERDDVWRRRRGSPEGRPEPKGQDFFQMKP